MAGKHSDYLLFVDTNVFLGFYRARHKAGLTPLTTLHTVSDRLIVTYQVAMEYKKNRQNVMHEAEAQLRLSNTIQIPFFLLQDRNAKTVEKSIATVQSRLGSLKKRLNACLLTPTCDPVYKAAQKIFRTRSDYNLSRSMAIRYAIRRLARKRFVLGYPPRKDKDTSIGDAVNWEWIIHCSKVSGKHVIVVSHDGDYGIAMEGQSYINDWLKDEFKRRVSRKRRIILTTSLVSALKMLGVKVSSKAEKEERQIVAPISQEQPDMQWYNVLRALAGAKPANQQAVLRIIAAHHDISSTAQQPSG